LRVPHGVACPTVSAMQIRAGVDRGGVELLDVFRLRARRVFGHVHDRDAVVDREPHRLRRLRDDPVEVPLLGELPDRRRADEEVGLDGDADALRDLDDRLDVVLVRAPRGAGIDGELLVHDLAGDALDGALHVRPRAGQADVGVVDADRVHVMEDAQLLVDGGIGD